MQRSSRHLLVERGLCTAASATRIASAGPVERARYWFSRHRGLGFPFGGPETLSGVVGTRSFLVVRGAHHPPPPGVAIAMLPGVSCPQAFSAVWNLGDAGPSPAECMDWMLSLPLLSGSGKFGSPWARMHLENANACAKSCCRCATATGCAPGEKLDGCNVLQALWAVWKRALLGLRSLPGPGFRSLRLMLPLLSGSGKSAMPWLRVHRANASGLARAPALRPSY